MENIKEILIIHHSHYDNGYVHPQSVEFELQKRFISEALGLTERYDSSDPEACFRWTCEVTDPLFQWWKQASGEDRDRLTQALAAERIGVGALQFNTTPLCTVSDMAAQLQQTEFLRGATGARIEVAMQADVNGLPWPVVDLLLDMRVKLLIMHVNIGHGGFPFDRNLIFRWVSPTGREILALNSEHYVAFEARMSSGANSIAAMQDSWHEYARRLKEIGYDHDFIYLSATNPANADNSPPNHNLIHLVREWNAVEGLPRMRMVTPNQLLDRVAGLDRDSLPRHAGDWTDYWNFGCASTATETAMNRRARTRLHAADFLAGAVGSIDESVRSAAWRNLILYDEHTWGVDDSARFPFRLETVSQRVVKSSYAMNAYSLGNFLLRDQMESLAGNTAGSSTADGVLIVNPSGVARRQNVRVPRDWIEQRWPNSSVKAHSIDRYAELYGDADLADLGVVELPPYGWSTVSFAEGSKIEQDTSGVVGSEGTYATPFHEIAIDNETGSIVSLRDRATDWDVVAPDANYPFLSIIRESVDEQYHDVADSSWGRNAFFAKDVSKLVRDVSCWQPDWHATYEQAAVRGNARVRVEGAELVLERRLALGGVEWIEQRITFSAIDPAIRVRIRLQKREEYKPEGIYLAMPVNVAAGWSASFDTCGVPVDLDTDQLPGTSRDWVTADSYACVYEDGHALTLACPDAPLVQIGGFGFGRKSDAINRDSSPLLLGWMMNNYWVVNFPGSQPGYCELSYALFTDDRYRPLKAARLAAAEMAPVFTHPVFGEGNPSGRLIDVDGDVLVHSVKPVNKFTIMAWVINPGMKAVTATVSVPSAQITQAGYADAAGNELDSIAIGTEGILVHLPGRAVKAVRLQFDRRGSI